MDRAKGNKHNLEVVSGGWLERELRPSITRLKRSQKEYVSFLNLVETKLSSRSQELSRADCIVFHKANRGFSTFSIFSMGDALMLRWGWCGVKSESDVTRHRDKRDIPLQGCLKEDHSSRYERYLPQQYQLFKNNASGWVSQKIAHI